MDPQTKFWVVVLGGVLIAWVLGEVLSLALWTMMRDRAMLAARLGWFLALVGVTAAVDAILGLYGKHNVLIGEGAAALVILLAFVLTYRRRVA